MAPRPAFTQNYGGTWFDSVSQAQDLLITGVARNTLVRNQYEALKERLLAGRTMRILLIDPDSPALLAAADRYYAARSPDDTQARVHSTLQILTELKHSTGGALTVRLYTHPIAMGMIAIDSRAVRDRRLYRFCDLRKRSRSAPPVRPGRTVYKP